VTTTSGDGTVTTAFNVANNTAPVVSGPSAASVTNGYSIAFTTGSLISVSDIDAAPTEKITLAVTTGMISVDLSGALASGCTITAGSNNSTGFTLSGAVVQLNAALATLVYTAPTSGISATLTAQANDGGATNNLSNTLSVGITLVHGNITGTSSADSVRIALDSADASETDVYVGSSSMPSYSVVLATISQWNVSLGAGDDTLTVDFSNGNPVPVGGLTYDGGTHLSGDTLSIIGTSGADNVVLTATQATLGAYAAMNFTNVQYFSFNLGAGQDSLVVQGGAPIITYNSGATTISSGRAQINNASALGDGSALTVGSSSAFASTTVPSAIVGSNRITASATDAASFPTAVTSSATSGPSLHSSMPSASVSPPIAESDSSVALCIAGLQAAYLRHSAGVLPWLIESSIPWDPTATAVIAALDAVLAEFGQR
jgi:hypothetical protein